MSETAADLEFDELEEGREASFVRRIGEEDLEAFLALSGDRNPLHADRQYAREDGQPDRVLHGAFHAALVSKLVGMHLPGRRSLLLGLKLDFVKPVHPGDELRVGGKVASRHEAQGVVVLKTRITRDGEVVARGNATVKVRA